MLGFHTVLPSDPARCRTGVVYWGRLRPARGGSDIRDRAFPQVSDVSKEGEAQRKGWAGPDELLPAGRGKCGCPDIVARFGHGLPRIDEPGELFFYRRLQQSRAPGDAMRRGRSPGLTPELMGEI